MFIAKINGYPYFKQVSVPSKDLQKWKQDMNAQHHDLLLSDVTTDTFVDYDVDVSLTQPTPSTDRRDLTSGKIGRTVLVTTKTGKTKLKKKRRLFKPKNADVQNLR